ncbi:MAG: hypothetical protein WCA98_09275 [Candidatus Acidiferrales bacterium]
MSSGPPDTSAWRHKVHPFFLKTAEYQKNVTLLTRSGSTVDREEADRLSREIPPELNQEADSLYDEMKAAGTLRHSSILKIFGAENLSPGSVISKNEYMIHWLCWFRYGKTFEQLKAEHEAGNFKAAKQFHALGLEFDKWKLGRLDPNTLKFKIDQDHFDLMAHGLDLGLENLSPQDLANCFDELCPCGRPHDPENLRKLRARIVKTFPPSSSEDAGA